MRDFVVFLSVVLVTALPAAAVEFLGVELCVGSVDTSVVLPVGSPLSLESAEIGRHGGLLLLLKADNGDIMDHLDNLMAFYTDTRGSGDAKKLQWSGGQITAYAQLIKKGYAALAVSTTQTCDEAQAAAAAAAPVALEPAAEEPAADEQPSPEAETEPPPPPVDPPAVVATTAAVAVEVDHRDETATSPPPPEFEDESAKTTVAEESEPVADFLLKGRLKHAPAEGGWVDVMGVVVNNSGAAYAVASFDLSLYDGAGNLICVDTVSVNQLRDGQERAFRSSIRCADYDDAAVVSWKLQFAGAH